MKSTDAMEDLPGSAVRTRRHPLLWKGKNGGHTFLSGEDKLVPPNILSETSTKGNIGLLLEDKCSTIDINEVPDTPPKGQLKRPSPRQKPCPIPRKRKFGTEFLFGESQKNEAESFDTAIQSGKKNSMRQFHEKEEFSLGESDPSTTGTPLRSMRQREPIQLHPYAIEAERYRLALGARTTKPFRVSQLELKKYASGGPRNPLRISQVEAETNRSDERDSSQQMIEEKIYSQVFSNDVEIENGGSSTVQEESSVTGFDNAGTFFTPINRRQSIRLGEEQGRRLMTRFSDIERRHDGPLFSKKMAGISTRSPMAESKYFSITDSAIPSTSNTPQVVTNGSDNISKTPMPGRHYSIFDYDEDELNTNTSMAKPSFRSARAFGRSIERRGEEKRVANLSDSIRTAYE